MHCGRSLKREWDAESSGKLPDLFIPSKTAPLVPKFAVEELPLGRNEALVPEISVIDLPLGRILDDDDEDEDDQHMHNNLTFRFSG